jgi:hypothetical protein
LARPGVRCGAGTGRGGLGGNLDQMALVGRHPECLFDPFPGWVRYRIVFI